MSAPVALLMAIHCHQPVGNFGFVFEQAYRKAYEPFLRALERHRGVRLALHYSGPLLDWLIEREPSFIGRVQALVARGQVELLASGYYEPILPLIPEPDRQGQIAKMRSAIRTHFGVEATGLWLTERVWEPDLPQTLARAGIRYTMVDTSQFARMQPWLPPAVQLRDEEFWDLFGSYVTESGGSPVVVFPASKRLRYWLPFRQVEETVAFLRRIQREAPVAITFADDGEKFGFWPHTHQWVFEEGWLERFFTALERERDWLVTRTFSEQLAASPPEGAVYLPNGSYDEMLEWSGGDFRNFFLKYPEAHAMQQKMLRASRALSRLDSAPEAGAAGGLRTERIARARQALYAAQCNCAYWHGVFGGLYLRHLRRAVYAGLIEAEQTAQELEGAVPAAVSEDLDGDHRLEISLSTAALGLVIDPAEGGALTGWDVRAARVNMLDVLTRRYEPYHDKLKARHARAAAHGAGEPASIHDLTGVKEDNLAAHLVYDDHRRTAFLDYGCENLPTLQELRQSTWGERRLWSGGVFELEEPPGADAGSLRVRLVRAFQDGTIRKEIRVAVDRPVVEFIYAHKNIRAPVVGLEFNISLRDGRYLSGPGEREAAEGFSIEEAGLGLALAFSFDPPARLVHFPIETVSESEEGLERTYQGLCLIGFWSAPVDRSGVNRWTGRIRCAIHAR